MRAPLKTLTRRRPRLPQSGGGSRISVEEIARELDIGRMAVYTMLEEGILPGVRVGRRWIVTRCAYRLWERTCGIRQGAGLPETPEVTVVN